MLHGLLELSPEAPGVLDGLPLEVLPVCLPTPPDHVEIGAFPLSQGFPMGYP